MYSKNNFLELIQKNDSHEIAKYFHALKPHSYITKNNSGWYVLQKNNTWMLSLKKPSALINDIADTFKFIIDEHINIINKEDNSDIKTIKIKNLNKFRLLVGNKSIGESIGDYLYSMYSDEEIYEKMDEHLNLFAFLDKVVNLDTGIVTDIEPEDYISITTGYNYPTVSNSIVNSDIKKFLYSLFENDEMVQFEIDKLSYALHGNKKHEIFIIETGEGRNGKGTKTKIVKNSFGNYYKSVPISLFTQSSDKKDSALPALVACKGMRYMECQEPEAKDKLNTGAIKEVTGRDIITCRALYGNSVYFVIQALLVIQANSVPKYNKYDNAIKLRNVIQPFPFIFVSNDKTDLKDNERYGDTNIKNKVSSNEWRDELILILLKNYQVIKDNATFHIPHMIKERTEENAEDNIPIKGWFDKNIKIGTDEIKNTVLYNIYRDSTLHPCNIKDFCSYLKLLNVNFKIKHKVFYWIDIEIISDNSF